ncbi:MAG: ribosomal protein S18-alanine N-acetyltransferase [Gammaproteobacteria bacterium]|nr:ribosomal protein S18-alanine N-acetyltransferase [Gammaproteobacteria bacterium]NNC96748.1 ribosomal protein S18-alanine N-acetyltransferase [Gammaproteobacteria bacterium]NNM13986.1 ribosomal protein S18-alanine N-acetyltransferase [Gammaproteobacteria bacterium]
MPVSLRRMQESDLDQVLAIETQSYPVPWTRGIFSDCLKVGYPAWVLLDGETIIGYILISVGANEAHLLNICIAPAQRRKGLARKLLSDMINLLQEKHVDTLFLEVRVSSKPAIALYEAMGFEQIGLRKDYYKTQSGKEDAVTYKMDLS